jgi:uncharacterized protein YwqG
VNVTGACQTRLVTYLDAQLARYRAALEDAGLGRRADVLCEAALPSIRLTADGEIGAMATGVSRLGGSPDLPPDVPWPTDDDGTPLSFIAQLDLPQVAVHDAQETLPRSGLLSFFYAAASQRAWGFDPADRGAWAVIYTADGAAARPREAPGAVPAEGRFAAVRLSADPELTFVPWESFAAESLMTREEIGVYAEVLPSGDPVIHRLLGHPDPVQGDMQLECQLAVNGVYCGDGSSSRDPRTARLRPGAMDWRLLMQVDSQDEAGMMWGDVGRLYYWIRQEDLTAGRWDRTWLILQCG